MSLAARQTRMRTLPAPAGTSRATTESGSPTAPLPFTFASSSGLIVAVTGVDSASPKRAVYGPGAEIRCGTTNVPSASVVVAAKNTPFLRRSTCWLGSAGTIAPRKASLCRYPTSFGRRSVTASEMTVRSPASAALCTSHCPAANVCVTVSPSALVPSPKSQCVASQAVNVTVSGAAPRVAGVASTHLAAAFGANTSPRRQTHSARRTAGA